MSATAELRQICLGAKGDVRAKPKPYSIERWFWLTQAGTFAFTLLLLASVLFLNWNFQERLTSSLVELQSTLNLNNQIRHAHESTVQAFWNLYSGAEEASASKYEQGVRDIDSLFRQYNELPLPPDERGEVARVRDLETQFLSLTGSMGGKRQQA